VCRDDAQVGVPLAAQAPVRAEARTLDIEIVGRSGIADRVVSELAAPR
jgi:hypothetical protein